MTVIILFAAHPDKWPEYEAPLNAALSETKLSYRLVTDADPESVDYIVYAPNSTLQDFRPYSRLKAVLNLWAGVETIVGNPTLTVPLARMVDPAMTQGMTEYVVGHVMRHHLGLDKHVLNTSGAWAPAAPPLAGDRTVAVLGLGALGRAAGTALAQLGFHVVGWSRSAKDIPSIECYHGESGLSEALAKAEIAVLLLPNTPDTENLLNAERLRLLPQGAVILNPGRGSLIDDEALLAALDDGHIGHATLDVFRNEPLPSEHPYWRHARVTVTPHIASETRPGSASRTIAVNIKRGEDGAPFLHLVDREKGY